jgi:Tfp pilus assembly protein PilV
LARRECREDGQSLFEVLIALAVLVVVLVPAVYLVTNSSQVVYNNQYKVAAANLANGQLETDRNLVVADQTILTAGQLATTTPQVGSEVYTINQVAGWCASPTSTTPAWGQFVTSTLPYAYGVMVTVTWKGNSSGVQVGGVLTTPGGISPTTGTTCRL